VWANAIVVARAVTPSIPISPRKLQNVLASIILGLLVAMGWLPGGSPG
jgi:uncharacterized protein involved in exopolysaccharide biosynthesis